MIKSIKLISVLTSRSVVKVGFTI